MKYPLYAHHKGELALAGGRPITDVSLEKLEELSPDELRIHEDVLRAQAEIAANAGFSQLAENLLRAAELSRVPDEQILEIYDALRPGRSEPELLEELARRLEQEHAAPLTAAFVREAAEQVQ